MCTLTSYGISVQGLHGVWESGFFIYEGDPENADWQALLQDFINQVRDGDYNAELKDNGLIKLDTHTIFPNIHGWKFVMYTYQGMVSKIKAIITIDD